MHLNESDEDFTSKSSKRSKRKFKKFDTPEKKVYFPNPKNSNKSTKKKSKVK